MSVLPTRQTGIMPAAASLCPRFSSGRRVFFVRVLLTLASVVSPFAAQAQNAPVGPRSVWNIEERGAFVMSSLFAGQRFTWFGTEDKGVWRYDSQAPQARAWRQFTTKDGLGDDNGYALAVDHQNRIWVGHQNHGVSVWNGRQWRNYDVLDGPLGERVFKIAVSPIDGSVWMGTSRGLSVYDPKSDSWRYYGRWNGLPSDQIQALDFASDGTLFVGTQCDGLAIGSPNDGYKDWNNVRAPFGMPATLFGEGLPSNLINDVMVGRDDTVYVATNYGLARSLDKGGSWAFLRGRDWRDKLKGLTFAPQFELPDDQGRLTLLEDYVTTLAEDAQGRIWLGHPSKGVEVRSAGARLLGGGGVVKTPDEQKEAERQQQADQAAQDEADNGPKMDEAGKPIPLQKAGLSQGEQTDYVTSILPLAGEAPLVCGAGSGVIQLGEQLAAAPNEATGAGEAAEVAELAALPSPAAPPSMAELQAFTKEVQGLQTPQERPGAAVLDDDWKTGGDWMGRYGTRYALLCAMGAPLDQEVVNDLSYTVLSRLGIHPYVQGQTFEDQGVRHWLHRERWDDPRVLYNPLIGYRRQADIDDNGESYPMSFEGPDLWLGVRIPAGTHRVSLYFFNKDGHDGSNRIRDYIIDVKRGNKDLVVANQNPTLARARVHDFWGGVYKSFLLQGPGDYFFAVRKNNSFNTVLQGVFIDKLGGPATPDETRRDVWLGQVRFEAPTQQQGALIEQAALRSCAPEQKARVEAALALWHALDAAQDKEGNQVGQNVGRLLAYRAVQDAEGAMQEGQALLREWRWRLPVWPQDDREEFDAAMEKGWGSVTAQNPYLLTGTH